MNVISWEITFIIGYDAKSGLKLERHREILFLKKRRGA